MSVFRPCPSVAMACVPARRAKFSFLIDVCLITLLRMTQVTLVTGCSGTGKTEKLLDHYRAALDRARAELRPGSTLWLTPNRRIQRLMTQQLMSNRSTACFEPHVLTFDRFAEKILEAAGRRSTPISPVMKRLLLRRIAKSLQDRGELRYFRSIAGTSGFLDVISGFISELKREEIWPDTFADACFMRTSAFARRDQEIGLIYTEYQRHLTEQNWYDNEGRFWLARTALSEGVRGPFGKVQSLVVDGFADFTQTQYEILGHLSGWIEDVSISLPLEQPLARHDLFVKPETAIKRIRQQLPKETTVRMERFSNGPHQLPGADHWAHSVRIIADRLFCNPRLIQASPDAAGLEIIAATGPMGEWEALAHRIKAMLAGDPHRPDQNVHVRPQEIVIGLRAISDEGPRLRNYLASAGLPVWCEAELPFASSHIVRAILSVIQLELEDWPFERLLAVLDSNFFQPQWKELQGGRSIRMVASLLRQLRLDSGREIILRVLARYANETSSGPSGRSHALSTSARLASTLVNRLSRTLDPFRRSHTLGDWADVLAAVGEELGWTKRTDTIGDRLADSESRDLDLLQRTLRTAAEADLKMTAGKRPQKLTLAEFAAELRDFLSHETLAAEPEPGGCIRILGIEQIRNMDVPHLFLLGLTENSFPGNRSEDCLFSEAERRDFISRGVALQHRSSHHADEMLLFYSVVTRARKSLTLSYPAVNSKGQPVFPSPYVTALVSLFTRDAITVRREGRLDPVPETERALTATDLRLAGMIKARQGEPELFRAVMEQEALRKPAWNTLAACEMADHRFHQRGFTSYEGRLELPQNLDRLRRQYGSQHQFSATELEAYARCPFEFWVSNVLNIRAVESPREGTDYASRGTLLHQVVAKLLIEGVLADPETLQKRFRELVRLELDRQVPETDLQRALINIERLTLNQWADAFAEQQINYDVKISENLKQLQSLAPEIPFGRLPEAPVATLDSHPAIQFGDAENTVSLRGRIDRVDVGSFEGHPAYVVVDYKTGKSPFHNRNELIAGRSIQLALYLLAIKRLGLVSQDAIPFQMGFWMLKETGFKPGMTRNFERLDVADVQVLETILDHLLPRLAEGIRSGRFVVENEDPNCTGRCPFRTVCRVNQLRPLAESLGKQSPPPVDPSADANEE